jgi:hypothetical protein
MSVSWPLGFAGGFQGSLTGLDNARFIARIYGRDYRELRDFVEDFSELGAHLKQPTKTYSSGMRARLAFALSLAIEFDCYLIDEVIMVGDQSFQRKCHYELFEKRSDRTLFLASHGIDIVRNFATAPSFWMRQGACLRRYRSRPRIVRYVLTSIDAPPRSLLPDGHMPAQPHRRTGFGIVLALQMFTLTSSAGAQTAFPPRAGYGYAAKQHRHPSGLRGCL